ncbi:MAG: NifU family protein [Flavobacteriales bacterium]|jgi:Fe-S cluster biogenesis protein NfuA|nr:NifU family protein [Flavobacteriales bacterium]MCF8460744.1 NifU family protein [Flavobacteriales bacterium]
MLKTIPYSVYAETTPNPTTMKFVANRVLLEQGLAEYTGMDEAKGSPMAMKLFSFPFVTGVFIQSNFITVMKSDMISWEDVVMELREFIRDYLNSGGAVVTELVEGTYQTDEEIAATSVHTQPSTDLEQQIIAILDAEIAPAVAQDGGNITFKSFENGVVSVVLRGACSGCPSSKVTLKNGIETLLKNRLPGEVTEVVAVNG